jgi:predicted dehydrogenase
MASSQTLFVVCDKGRIEVPKPFVPPRDEPCEIIVDTSVSHDLSELTLTRFDALDQYEEEIANFSRVLRGEAAPFFGIEDAVANMRVLDAIFASMKSERWEAI